ncbi:hypothetical protein KBD59_04450 [Candidatus Gracilibacteria bacterium]|nr:hypothetical protein [Candidatus Gracilibacteria bacterium]
MKAYTIVAALVAVTLTVAFAVNLVSSRDTQIQVSSISQSSEKTSEKVSNVSEQRVFIPIHESVQSVTVAE